MINKIDQPLVRLTKKKGNKVNTTNIIHEGGVITADAMDFKRTINYKYSSNIYY